MNRFFIVIAISLTLSGCAGFTEKFNEFKATVTSALTIDNADTIEAAYGTALTAGNTYRRLCQRKVINKRCWDIIERLQPYNEKAHNSVVSMRAFVDANPSADASSFIIAAKASIAAFKSEQARNGVK